MILLFGLYFSLYFIGLKKFGQRLNIMTIFLVIFYLSNHAFYVIYKLGGLVVWRADPSVGYYTIDTISAINNINLLTFGVLILSLGKRKSIQIPEVFLPNRGFFYLYFLFTALLLYVNRELLQGLVEYGADQSKGVQGTFNPLNRVITFRIFFAIYYLLYSKNKKGRNLIIFTELLISLILFERKEFALVFGSYLLHGMFNKKSKYKLTRYLALTPVLTVMFMLPIYRSFVGDDIRTKVIKTIAFLGDNIDQLSYLVTGLVDSEGVQNWTYQLIEQGRLELTYGMTYIQGIINMFILRPLQPLWLQQYQAAYYFKDVAYPTVTNHGYDYTFSAEALLNWGPNYAWISYVILAFIVLFIYNRKGMYAWKITIWPIILIGMRTDSTTVLRLISYLIAMEVISVLYNSFRNNVWNLRTGR